MAEWGKVSKPISTNQLANQLRRFGVVPSNIKTGDGKVLKGYRADDFDEAFARYLPPKWDSDRYPATTPGNMGDSSFSETLPAENGSGCDDAVFINKDGVGSGVADQKPEAADNELEEAMLL